ncbi:MAG: sulfite exporter TauE/SafE family protein [Propionibacteriaceae bacterium]|jgi:sulfite exporter TauE/SafE/copper chaperone CopZ|nr:sulfite exporter TauE/SafE family protein [Propionibacteriaceae bacterium]
MGTKTVHISGMYCRACEVRVGKKLRAVPGIVDADVSAAKGTAVLSTTGAVDDQAIEAAVRKAGYVVATGAEPWLAKDTTVWRDFGVGVAVVAAGWLLLRLFGITDLANALVMDESAGLGFVALVGVAASVSTCMALVGGIVMGVTSTYAQAHPDATRAQLLRPQLLFHVGRVVGFAALGGVIGALGSVVSLQGTGLAVGMIVVAVVMTLLGIRLTGISPRLSGASLALPPSLTSWMTDGQTGEYRAGAAVGLGVASFFLPCGFTQAVQVFALATGDPLRSASIMGVFALATVPGLLGAGMVSSVLRQGAAQTVLRCIGVVVLAFALVNVTGGVRSLSSALGWGAVQPPPASATVPDGVLGTDGRQRVTTAVEIHGYEPASQVVYAGIPVDWTLLNNSVSCAAAVNAKSLGAGSFVLYPGNKSETVEFTLNEPGVYNYSCQMGMYRGQFIAVPYDG